MSFKEELCLPFNFITPVEVTVEETASGVAMITGTLLIEGLSRNKNLYTIQEMASIAKSTEGAPIYTGTMTKIDPNTGLLTKNMHANKDSNRIGKIIKTVFNKTKRKIKFWAEIVNTANFLKIHLAP